MNKPHIQQFSDEIQSIVEKCAENLDELFPTDTPDKNGVNSNFCGRLEIIINAMLCGYRVEPVIAKDTMGLTNRAEDDTVYCKNQRDLGLNVLCVDGEITIDSPPLRPALRL